MPITTPDDAVAKYGGDSGKCAGIQVAARQSVPNIPRTPSWT
jgi:hypothetical protein